MQEMSRMVHELYERNSDSLDYKRILDNYVEYCWTAFRVIKAMYFSAGIFMLILPCVLRVFTSNRILPFASYLPFLDQNSSPGYELNYIYHFFVMLIGVCAFSFSDTFNVSLMIIALGHLKIMMRMLQDVDLILMEPKSDPNDQKRRLKRICQEHQFHIE